MAEMQTTIQKMDVESLITQRIPEVETVLSASNWFKDEEMTLDFGAKASSKALAVFTAS